MKYTLLVLALSLGVAQAEITAGMLNQIHNGANIQGGTYFNTAGLETKFTNSAGTGISLNAGQNIRGVEAANGAYTGNGGSIHIQAPGQVVKLDGNIDVRGFLANGSSTIPGNGGKVTVDASYLFQSGNIYASGYKGGNVQFNVDGMTMNPWAMIDARSVANNSHQFGGSVSINSTGQVDIKKDAKIDVSGAASDVSGNFSNIVASGSVVNTDGILMANQAILGVSGGSSHQSGTGGGITLVAKNGNVTIGPNAIVQADAVQGNDNGRTITVTASNDINQNGLVLSKGGDGANSVEIWNGTDMLMPLGGGNGGTVNFNTGHDINQAGRIVTDGGKGGDGYWGGDAGTMTFYAGNNILNTGVIRSIGGDANLSGGGGLYNVNDDFHGGAGGNISFINANPTGNGAVVTFGGHGDPDGIRGVSPDRMGSPNGSLGTITAPDPVSSTNTLMGIWKKMQ
jgi:hypothetical protein